MKRIAAVIYLLVPDGAASQAAFLEDRCRAYADRFCWDVLGTYVDTELPELSPALPTGARSFGLPGLEKAIAAVQQKQATILLTTSEDMLGTSDYRRNSVHKTVEGYGGFVQTVGDAA
jgi:hypothetical protein